MKVSVAIITYNQAEFISQAIDSVLMQEVSFDYEIVIGEDCSTDGTRDILTAYQKKHPERIRLLLHEKNLGMNRNFIQTLQACDGKYVALLEGDDRWVSPYKLQKQVDFLENHPDCVMSFHNVVVQKEADKYEAWWYLPSKPKEFFTLEDLLRGNFIPTGSTIFRAGLVEKFPEWFHKIKLGDWPFFVLLAQHGTIGFINEIMGVYRVHSMGGWSMKPKILRADAVREMYEHIYEHVNANPAFRFDRNIMGIVARGYFNLAYFYEANGNLVKAKSYALKCLGLYRFHQELSRWSLLKTLLRLYFSSIYMIYKGITRLSRKLRQSTL